MARFGRAFPIRPHLARLALVAAGSVSATGLGTSATAGTATATVSHVVTAAGTSATAGTATATVTPAATVPGVPLKVRPSDAFGYSSTIALDWDAPASDGGSAITDYVIQYSSNDGSSWTTYSDGTSTTSAATITGLTAGTRYVFQVAAVNAIGQGSYTTSDWGCTPVTASAAQTTPTGSTATGMPWGPARLDEHAWLDDTSFRRAWTGSGVRVYIVDSGIYTSHTEFASANLHDAYSYDSTTAFVDTFSHGTWCASLVVGPTVGIAPGVELYVLRGYDGSGVDLEGAFAWIRDNHPGGTPGVVTCSALFLESTTGARPSVVNPIVDSIIDTHGMAVFQCTSNTFSPTHDDLTPRPGLIHVGGIAEGDGVYVDGLLTPRVDIFAPSANIYTANTTGTTDYGFHNGTSFGTPMAAGVAAMWLEGNPNLTPRQIDDLIKASSTKDLITGTIGSNPNRILYSLADIPPSFSSVSASGLGTSATSGSATATVSHVVTAAGASATSGTAAATVDHVVTASGTSSTSGTASATVSKVVTAAGTSTTTGTAAAVVEHVVTGLGTSATSGTATALPEHVVTGAGTSPTSGIATAVVEHIVTGSGVSATSGTATATVDSAGSISATGLGTSATSGAATATVDHPVTASGTTATSGTATALVEHSVTGVGVSSTSGTAVATVTPAGSVSATGLGVSATSGTATATVSHVVTGLGTSASSGTATATVFDPSGIVYDPHAERLTVVVAELVTVSLRRDRLTVVVAETVRTRRR